MKATFLFFYYFLYPLFHSHTKPGRLNINYPITDYSGSFYLDTSITNSYLYDFPVIVNWSTGKFLEHTQRQYFWIADNISQVKMITSDCK